MSTLLLYMSRKLIIFGFYIYRETIAGAYFLLPPRHFGLGSTVLFFFHCSGVFAFIDKA